MARKQTFTTGPAAYHARLEQEKIAALEAKVAELKAALEDWIPLFQHAAAIRSAVKETYAKAHKDGYCAGWRDHELGVAPHMYPDVEPPKPLPPRFRALVKFSASGGWDSVGTDPSADALASYAMQCFPTRPYRIEPIGEFKR